CPDLADVAAAREQLVALELGVGGIVEEGAVEEAGGAHRRIVRNAVRSPPLSGPAAPSRGTSMRSLLLVLVLLVALATLAFFDCTLTSVGIVPLNDLGPGLYVPGTIGGLYPGGQDVRPAAHLAAGRAIATTEVLPRNAAGAVDLGNGKIGLVSIGMSNTTQEFGGSPLAFKPRADLDPSKDPHVVIVDGAQGGKAASNW